MNNELYVSYLGVNGMVTPIGIDTHKPVFHYKAAGSVNEKEIMYYQILVKDESQLLVWDSGKCPCEGVPYVTYGGKPLMPKTAYTVTVRLWDEKDCATEESQPVLFETGMMGEKWIAAWIEPVQEAAQEEKQLSFFELLVPNPEFWGGEARLEPCQNIRKAFACAGKIKKARLYASAHGVYQVSLNGRLVGKNRLAPETSVYEEILYYQTYDITDNLTTGDNVLGVVLGDGWWIGRLGLSGDSCSYGNKLGFIMQMEIQYEDGSSQIITSDNTFKCTESMIRYSDLYIGEKQDFTYEIEDWDVSGFDDSGWDKCEAADYTTENLTGQLLDAVEAVEEITPAAILTTPSGELVLDFGQVVAGVCRFEVEGSRGQQIIFEHGEVLDCEGNYKNNILGRNKDQKDVLVCKDGHQVFEPRFTYHGFRYVKVTGIESDKIKATALVIATPIRKTGSFECSDGRLNQLQKNIEWSTLGNMCSIPTDCPQREKLGWTGDIQVYAKTGCFNYDLKRFLEAWMENLRADQYENGEVPVTVPNHPYQDKTQRMLAKGSNSSSGWGDACVLVPYYLYQSYGGISVLKDNFNAMEKWLDYVKNQAAQEPEGFDALTPEEKARNPYLWTKGYHFGDWLIPSLRALPNGVALGTEKTAAVVGACFYAITVEAFVQVCAALGEVEKAAQYEFLLVKIRDAIRETFVAEDGRVYDSDLQGLYVMVLRAGAVTGELEEKVLDRLVVLIKHNGDCLDTGFLSVSYLLDVLSDKGRMDIAYKLLFQTQAPSWLYMVEQGATTMWENWRGINEDGEATDSSFNHYALGCVGDWIYRHIGGIKIIKPGYKQVEISPDFNCGLTYSRCAVETTYGPLSVEWRKSGEKLVMDVMIPVDTEAEIMMDGKRIQVKSGSYRFEV